MKIIRKRQRHESVSYSYGFDFEGEPGCGFAFPCDEHGTVDVASMAPTARESLAQCRTGRVTVFQEGVEKLIPVVDRGVRRYAHSYVEPAVGECSCGEEVVLDGFTNTCEGCEADYNSSGQLLAPREFWGEETGESLADILSIP